MKVLLASGMFPPMRTGTSFYTWNLAKSMKEQGADISILTLGDMSDETVDGIKIRRIPALALPLKNFFKHYKVCSFNPMNWVRTYKLLKADRPDSVLLVNHYLDIAIVIVFVCKLLKIPVVCSVGTQLQSLNPKKNQILRVLDWLVCGKFVFPLCKYVVAWDREIKRYLVDSQGKKILRKVKIVNYGVNGDVNRLLSSQPDYSKNFSIIGVGAVSEQRSFVPLVKAFNLIKDRFPDATVNIYGHVYYDEAPRLVEMLGLKDRVFFHGECSHDDVLSKMSTSGILFSALTAKYAGLGTAAIEGMFSGLPLVVNTPLNLLGRERLVDGEHIIQCQETDPAVIADRLACLLSDADKRQKIGQEGRNYVVRNLHWDVVSRDMMSLLKMSAEKIA